jgi:hypothetical protein
MTWKKNIIHLFTNKIFCTVHCFVNILVIWQQCFMIMLIIPFPFYDVSLFVPNHNLKDMHVPYVIDLLKYRQVSINRYLL